MLEIGAVEKRQDEALAETSEYHLTLTCEAPLILPDIKTQGQYLESAFTKTQTVTADISPLFIQLVDQLPLEHALRDMFANTSKTHRRDTTSCGKKKTIGGANLAVDQVIDP